MATLYRCTTPTDWLCPCGRVARALRREGVAVDTVRVPQRRSQRPEVEALSGQRRVPLLVIDGDVIFDASWIRAWKQEYAFLTGAVRVASNRDGAQASQMMPLAVGQILSPIQAAKEGFGLPVPLLQSNTKLITQMPHVQTASDTILSRLEQVSAELNAIREAVAPGLPNPAEGTDTDGTAQEH